MEEFLCETIIMNSFLKKTVSITHIIIVLMKVNVFFMFFLCFLSCSDIQPVKYSNNNGLLIEKFNDSNLDENKYNNDNLIYTTGKKFTFDYVYSKENIEYKISSNKDKWDFIHKDSIHLNSNVITDIIIEVADKNPMSKYIPDYNQTVIKYFYSPFTTYNMTGLVENKKNIWIHPPRKDLFEILELNPFPFIKYPLEVGNKWSWELEIGDRWSNPKWKVWKGSIRNVTDYEIIDLRNEKTIFGILKCYVINASSISRIGQTELIAFFNIEYGFIKLIYKNIDDSNIEFTLTEIENN